MVTLSSTLSPVIILFFLLETFIKFSNSVQMWLMVAFVPVPVLESLGPLQRIKSLTTRCCWRSGALRHSLHQVWRDIHHHQLWICLGKILLWLLSKIFSVKVVSEYLNWLCCTFPTVTVNCLRVRVKVCNVLDLFNISFYRNTFVMSSLPRCTCFFQKLCHIRKCCFLNVIWHCCHLSYQKIYIEIYKFLGKQ